MRVLSRAVRPQTVTSPLLALLFLAACTAPPADRPASIPVSTAAPESKAPAPSLSPAPQAPAAPPETPPPSPLIEALTQAVKAKPDDGPLLYFLASLHAERADKKAALERLEQLAALRYPYALQKTDFARIAHDPDYQDVAARIAQNEPSVSRSAAAFTLPEKDLIPEGIAHDPQTNTFYVGSIHKRKIVAFKEGKAPRDFAPEAKDGLLAVLGLKVDTKRGRLFAASISSKGMKGYTPDAAGRSALFEFDLRTGDVVRKVFLGSPSEAHLLNDLAVTRAGDVYVTDSDAGAVHVLRRGADKLEVLVPAQSFSYPNGIALSGDEKYLFVAHFRGIARVDPKTGQFTPMAAASGIVLGGIDGLSLYKNGFVAVQNSIGRARVTRYFLDAELGRVEREDILESKNALFDAIPTTGVLSGAAFYYIANSQLRALNEAGQLAPESELREPQVLKVTLAH
jgi:sugar lactone lactonase YvrE